MSFWKHYWDGVKYINRVSESAVKTKDEIREISIDDDIYSKGMPVYEYAMDKTVQELEQAVEGMYHNLNLVLLATSGNDSVHT